MTLIRTGNSFEVNDIVLVPCRCSYCGSESIYQTSWAERHGSCGCRRRKKAVLPPRLRHQYKINKKDMCPAWQDQSVFLRDIQPIPHELTRVILARQDSSAPFSKDNHYWTLSGYTPPKFKPGNKRGYWTIGRLNEDGTYQVTCICGVEKALTPARLARRTQTSCGCQP